jgi:hypothetical protein
MHHQEFVAELGASLRRIKGIDKVLKRMVVARPTVADWKSLQDVSPTRFLGLIYSRARMRIL